MLPNPECWDIGVEKVLLLCCNILPVLGEVREGGGHLCAFHELQATPHTLTLCTVRVHGDSKSIHALAPGQL